MDWATISEAQLQTEGAIDSASLLAYSQAALRGGLDPVSNMITNAVNEARAKIGSCQKVFNELGPDGTVPPEARNAVMVMVAYRLYLSIPTSKNDDASIRVSKRTQYEQALSLLNSIQKGDVFITKPSSFSASQLNLPDRSQLVRTGRCNAGSYREVAL